jgi:hypothetical protein
MAPKAQAREHDTSTFGTILSRTASTNGIWMSNIVPPKNCYRRLPKQATARVGNRSVLKNICPMTYDHKRRKVDCQAKGIKSLFNTLYSRPEPFG